MKTFKLFALLLLAGIVANAQNQPQIKTANGIVQGVTDANGITAFKGIPYAKPPVGNLRWKAPEPSSNWHGVLKADTFGPRAMQKFIFSDMRFRSKGMSEDCLYLNVWAPANVADKHLPVLVYFYGGGFAAGDGSECRYDGENMARKGIITVTVNYRLGIFGFFSLPDLTKESRNHASGNYGLLDQNEALRWVQKNIAAFGGDPAQVTIAGESAGSMSVSAQMASPLSKGLFARAIGESGAIFGNLSPEPLLNAEQKGVQFAAMVNATSLEDLRKIPADSLLADMFKPGMPRFSTDVDGYFLPETAEAIFSKNQQSDVPVLAGWNSAEQDHQLTLENYKAEVQKQYKDKAAAILQLYPATTDAEAAQSATDLASDRFIVYATWKWLYMHNAVSGQPVYRYKFSSILPDPGLLIPLGARHASEIEYALGNLYSNPVYAWTAEDYKTSAIIETYFANFIKTGNPNSADLPQWPLLKNDAPVYMNIDSIAHAEPELHQKRYMALDSLNKK